MKVSHYLLIALALIFAGFAVFGFVGSCKNEKRVKYLNDSIARILEAKITIRVDTFWTIRYQPVVKIEKVTVIDSVLVEVKEPIYERTYSDSTVFDDLVLFSQLNVTGRLNTAGYGYRLKVPRIVERVTEIVRPAPIKPEHHFYLYMMPGLDDVLQPSVEIGAAWTNRKGFGLMGGYQRHNERNVYKAGVMWRFK